MKKINIKILIIALIITSGFKAFATNEKTVQYEIIDSCGTLYSQVIPCIKFTLDKENLGIKHYNYNGVSRSSSPVFKANIPFFKYAVRIDKGTSYEYIIGIESNISELTVGMIVEPTLRTIFRAMDDGGKIVKEHFFNERDLRLIKKGKKLIFPYEIRKGYSKFISFEINKKDTDSVKIRLDHVSPFVAALNTESDILKSYAVSEAECNNYITCMDNQGDFKNEYSGVFKIWARNAEYDENDDFVKYHNIYFTGFTITTMTNYDYNALHPVYAFTCRHGFHFSNDLLEDPVNHYFYYTWEEVAESNGYCQAYFNNQRATCAGGESGGTEISPNFSIVRKGNWYDDDDFTEDYLLLQFNDFYYDVGYFKDNNIGLCGWRYDFLDSYAMEANAPYHCFHHARVDIGGIENREKKYAKANTRPLPYFGSDIINITWDEGFTTPGASGSPVFDKNHLVVGMAIATDPGNTCENPNIGPNYALRLSSIYNKNDISSIINPRCLENSSVYTFNPGFQNLREKCTNCQHDPDIGEKNIDCGGPCKPCKLVTGEIDYEINDGAGIEFVQSNSNLTIDVPDNSFNMPVTLFASGITINNIGFAKSASLYSQNGITINRGYFPAGYVYNFDFAANNSAIEVKRDCEEDVNNDLCGIEIGCCMHWGDWWGITGKNIGKYEYTIFNRDGQLVSSRSGDVFHDGFIQMWDSNTGNNVNRGATVTLTYLLTLWDCKGTRKDYAAAGLYITP